MRVNQDFLGDLLRPAAVVAKPTSKRPGPTSHERAAANRLAVLRAVSDGGRVGHWVVVDGVDEAGMVMIRDPWNATSYTMTQGDFMGETSGWNGYSVLKHK